MIADLEKTDTLFYTESVGSIKVTACKSGGIGTGVAFSVSSSQEFEASGADDRTADVRAADDDWAHDDYDQSAGLVLEESKPKLKPPKQYKVVVINDDYTPMEFVVQVLMTFFAMDNAKATRVMMSVHTKGKGICGIFSHEIAETKVDQVNEFSRINQHPLMCTMEET